MEKNLLQQTQLNFVQTPVGDAIREKTRFPKETPMKHYAGPVKTPVETAVGPEA